MKLNFVWKLIGLYVFLKVSMSEVFIFSIRVLSVIINKFFILRLILLSVGMGRKCFWSEDILKIF